MKPFIMADLFCGAGGTSTGAVEAVQALGMAPKLTAINHWDRAIATHTANHPTSRHFCASLDALNPRDLFAEGELDLLWASPECTNHSRAKGGRPKNDQSRSTAHCVSRWAEALRPGTVLVENVPEFLEWGPIGSDGKPIQSKKGTLFQAWKAMLEACGYKVDYRILCAADYGDPTTRRRLFVQAQRGKRKIVWPEPTHSPLAESDMFGSRLPWVGSSEGVIDWTIPAPSITSRKRPLAPKTMRRIREGLQHHGGAPFIVAMEHGGRTLPASLPLPTMTCAKGGAFGVAYLLEYYGNGTTHAVTRPLPTVTTHDRFALIHAQGNEVGFRMLQPHELAAAQGFRKGYIFTGTKTEAVKQIGNAVPRNLARAIVLAAIGQKQEVAGIYKEDAA